MHDEDHFYVFSVRDGYECPVYECTFPSRDLAWRWCDSSMLLAFVLCNCLPDEYYY